MIRPTPVNIVVIWANDVDPSQLGCYSRSRGAHETPNIDRLAREGMLFTNAGGDPCPDAAVEFMTGHGSAPHGAAGPGASTAPAWRPADATLASLLRERGYATGHFGALRPGAIEHCLACLDGFDELEIGARPMSPQALDEFAWGAVGAAASTEPQPWWARLGQRRENAVALHDDRAEISDEELITVAKLFMRRQRALDRPFFAWIRATHTHTIGRRARADAARARESHARTVLAHDRNVGEVLDHIDHLGLADDTFVVYSGSGPQPSEPLEPADSEAGFGEPREDAWAPRREPLLVRWPGRIQAGSICNGLVHYRDWLPTLLAVAGEPIAKDRRAGATSRWLRARDAFEAGANVLPFLTGHAPAPAPSSLTYFDDDGGTLTFRYDNWEVRSGERFAPLRRQAPRPRGLRATEHGAAASPAAKVSTRRRMHRGTAHRAGAR